MRQEDVHFESLDDNEDSNDGVVSCLNFGGMSLAANFVQQQKIQFLKAAQEEERKSIRETHLKHETFKIIESLLEGKTDEEYLIKCASLLSQADFDNVHEERSLAFFCGYPICDNRLPQLSLKKRNQKFKLDLRSNQIYRMEEYRLFCSVQCFRSSYYLREQMSSEPLWMRYTDAGGYDELYSRGFQTLKLYHLRELENRVLEEEKTVQSSTEKAKIEPQVMVNENVSFPYIKQEHLEHLRKSINNLTIKERNVSEVNAIELSSNMKEKGELKKERVEEESKLVFDHDRGMKTEKDEKFQTKSDERTHTIATKNQVYERLKEWMTFDSLIFIFGSSIIDELIQLQSLKINDAQESSIRGRKNQDYKDEISREKKMEDDIKEICKRLDDEEILEKLVYESQQFEEGKTRVENEVKRKLNCEDDLKQGKQRKGKCGRPKKVTFAPTASAAVSDPNSVMSHVFPPTGSKSQNKLRKQLFFRQLNRTLTVERISPEIVSYISPLTREFIDTFKFTSINVIISHNDWPELLLLILKILETRERNNTSVVSDFSVMTDRSVSNLYQKICPDELTRKTFDESVSTLLDYRNF